MLKADEKMIESLSSILLYVFSLVQSLMNSRYRAYMDRDEPITDGIDIKTWKVPIDGEKDMLTFSVWDFAGQTVYYNTHQVSLNS